VFPLDQIQQFARAGNGGNSICTISLQVCSDVWLDPTGSTGEPVLHPQSFCDASPLHWVRHHRTAM